jgi:hypothetical protein
MDKKLKILQIIHYISAICPVLALIFCFVNSVCGKLIFNAYVLLPLLALGVIGTITGIVLIAKLSAKSEDAEQDEE